MEALGLISDDRAGDGSKRPSIVSRGIGRRTLATSCSASRRRWRARRPRWKRAEEAASAEKLQEGGRAGREEAARLRVEREASRAAAEEAARAERPREAAEERRRAEERARQLEVEAEAERVRRGGVAAERAARLKDWIGDDDDEEEE